MAGAQGGRRVNADAVASARSASGDLVFALADGIGDNEVAATAARVAASAAVSAGGGAVAAVLAAGVALRALPAGDCVLVVAVPVDDGYEVAWVGDARAYAWNGAEVRQVTVDQTVAQYFRDRGVVVGPRLEHVVTASARAVERAGVGVVSVPSVASLVLASDGVSVPLAQLANILRYAGDPAAALVRATGSADNATAIVVEGAGVVALAA
ncbi:serine/threonine protein phosphatase [Actinokineospora sp. NBRC 105648]|nr:serine/threonine protein phosphatase [Actinokineospora sp. NBRC 105648]